MSTRKPSLEIFVQPEAIWDLIYAVSESAVVPPLLLKENIKRIRHYKKFIKRPKRKNTPPNILFSSTGLEISGFLLGSIINSEKRQYIIERAIPSLSSNRADDWVECSHQSNILIRRLNRFANRGRQIVGQFHSHPEIDKERRYIEENELNQPSEGDLISSKYKRNIDIIMTISARGPTQRAYRQVDNPQQIACFSYQGFYYWIYGHKNRCRVPINIPNEI